MLSRLTRPRAVAVCALPVVALIATALFVPLPFSLAQPGMTANVLGDNKGAEVITIAGARTRATSGQLRMTTIEATGPDTHVSLGDIFDSWFRTDRAVMPRDAVYPSGQSVKEIEEHNTAQMKESQDAATEAALKYLDLNDGKVKVTLKLADVGGPSAGLLFTLGIIDKLDGDGAGGDLTGGRTIAGTGTIDEDGTVGAVGGVALKTQAAKRDGATVFLVPKEECADAKAELPKGLRLIPVTSLKGAVSALTALESGKGSVPAC
ncbi:MULTISPECIES: S16 family serine protease [unclassified Streptomyces]|uniref:S16 family serine protease n=1 Tax=unclassified Streptomyces TaxID=2593676 RepID=UPI0024732F18|nr:MULTISPECIES: S16 family serine protease [unclassified Streptomyces]MDH6450530.1 PDZ domain-containing protein [Streptomyces sp. SAI-119]MDH6498925.1 PDZ domain-containing protein [Streptomyces sp. SAI-149]